VGGGGKALSGEQVFELRFQGGLVALDRQHIVPAPFEEDLLRGLILGMHRVGEHYLALETLPAQELARGGDFVAFGGRRDTAQEAPLPIDGIDDLHPGVTHFLAIDDDEAILARAQDLVLPAQEHRFHLIVSHLLQHPGKGGLAGVTRLAGIRVGAKPQGA